jgi:TPR repeat protein
VDELYWQGEPDLRELHHAYGLMATDPARAVAKLTDLAERGSLMSMVYLADAYKKGTGVNVDVEKADELYDRAAKGGSVVALYHLGRGYLDKGQLSKAKEPFKISADKGYLPSVGQLGRMYAKGIGVPEDVNTGREYLERASGEGYVFPKRDLALLLMRGKFGNLARIRGAWLFLVAIKDVFVVIFTDPSREHLR